MNKPHTPTYFFYRWLNSNASRAESDLYFTKYRDASYTILAGYIKSLIYKYRLNQDTRNSFKKGLTAEERFMHELMVRLCIYTKNDRPNAIESILQLENAMTLPHHNPPCPGQVAEWRHEICEISHTAKHFFEQALNHDDQDQFQGDRHAVEFNAKIPGLQQEGYELLNWLVSEIDQEQDGADQKLSSQQQAIKTIQQRYHKAKKQKDSRVKIPSSDRFVIDVDDIIEALPKIRIPGIGLLIDWAEWVAADLHRENKPLGLALPGEAQADDLDSDTFHPVPAQLQSPDIFDNEQDIFFKHIDRLLRKPVEEAEKKRQESLSSKCDNKIQKRLERAKSRYAENMKVLMLALDGHSREDIAYYSGLTEDKVRKRKAYIAETLAPEFIEAYRAHQAAKLMEILRKLSDGNIPQLLKLAEHYPLLEWPQNTVLAFLRMPQKQAMLRLRKAELNKLRKEDKLVEKLATEDLDPVSRNEARMTMLQTVMSIDAWDKRTLMRLGLNQEEALAIKKSIIKADFEIERSIAEQETLRQDFNRRVELYPPLLSLLVNFSPIDAVAITDCLGLKEVEQLYRYRKQIRVILECLSNRQE